MPTDAGGGREAVGVAKLFPPARDRIVLDRRDGLRDLVGQRRTQVAFGIDKDEQDSRGRGVDFVSSIRLDQRRSAFHPLIARIAAYQQAQEGTLR
jgi:hypothetical protein